MRRKRQVSRQEYWKEKGYTKEQIEVHLDFERRKSKESRDRRKKNNKENGELIKKIKNDLLNQQFDNGHAKSKVLRISPSTDGRGFWCKNLVTFKDGSEGEYRVFCYFDDYSLRNFMELLT